MSYCRSFCCPTLMLLLLAACGEYNGGRDLNTATSAITGMFSEIGVLVSARTKVLPKPKIVRARLPTRTAAEMARLQEVEEGTLKKYRGYRIVDTTQTYSGDIIDWIDPTTIPGSEKERPPQLRSPSGQEDELQSDRVGQSGIELVDFPELRGPDNTIPITRPRPESYIQGKTSARNFAEFILNMQPGAPGTPARLYAGYRIRDKPVRGVVGRFNHYKVYVEPGTFTLAELAVEAPGTNILTTMEQVGIVFSQDTVNFDTPGDTGVGGVGVPLRLQLEYFTRGTGTTGRGDGIGGWDGLVTGFVPVSRPYGPGVMLSPVSTVGGAQYESTSRILLYQGNWWIAHQGNWLGYYPGTLFNRTGGTLKNGAYVAEWYGEVYDPTPSTWTSTDMGSGREAMQGTPYAAYVANPYYIDNNDGVSKWVEKPDVTVSDPFVGACYSTTPYYSSTTITDPYPPFSNFYRWFYIGGGGAGGSCQ